MPEPKKPEEKAAEEALKAQVAEKEKEIAELKEAVEKANKRVENAEKKFTEWSGEIGDIRKEGETLKNTLAEAQTTIIDSVYRR